MSSEKPALWHVLRTTMSVEALLAARRAKQAEVSARESEFDAYYNTREVLRGADQV
jgi:hypothetical protein